MPDQNPLLTGAPTWADAYDYNANALANWVGQQRQISADRGLWNDKTGLPTGAGIVNAAGQTANALMMGTTAPSEPPAWRFMDAFDAAHAKSGFGDVSHVRFFEHGPDQVEISHIQVDPSKRGQGVGNKLMEMVTDQADKHGITLHASPASDADAATGLDYEGLRDWYQRWGFDEAGGGDRLTRRPYRPE